MTTTPAARLARALDSLAHLAEGNSAPALRLSAIFASLRALDAPTALGEIRSFADQAERMGVAPRLKPLFAQLLDMHGLATLAR